jgi:hypothetical protein
MVWGSCLGSLRHFGATYRRTVRVSLMLLAIIATGGLLRAPLHANDELEGCLIELDIVPAPVISQTSTVELLVPTCPETDRYELVLAIPKHYQASSVSPKFKDLISGGGDWDRHVNYFRFEGSISAKGASYSGHFIPQRETTHSTGYDEIRVYIYPANEGGWLDGNNDTIWTWVGSASHQGEVLYSFYDLPGIYGENDGRKSDRQLFRPSVFLLLVLSVVLLLIWLKRGGGRRRET